jgi:flagellar protein FlgJ
MKIQPNPSVLKQGVPGPAPDKESRELRKTCREFESLLIAQMLKSMRATVPESDLFGSKEKEEIFRSMLDDETARQVAQTGAFKLGDIIYEQLSRQRKG